MERAALIYQHSNVERQKEVAGGIDTRVRAERQRTATKADEERSGADLVQDA